MKPLYLTSTVHHAIIKQKKIKNNNTKIMNDKKLQNELVFTPDVYKSN